MQNRTLIVITGHPGSGKTTLARQLSKKHHIPFVSKDNIKERIFDALGSKDKDWSLKVSAAAHRIMDDFVVQELRAGHSIIVESNFKVDVDSQRFTKIINECQAGCVQILCGADGETLFARWNDRIARGLRHEGHAEKVSLEQIRQNFTEPYPALQLPGKLIELDTSDVSRLQVPLL